jgi:ribose-phosphate pyrophosphokinase
MENGYLTQTTEKRLMIVSGEGYPELAERIAERLDQELSGVELVEFPAASCTPGTCRACGGPDMFIIQSLGDPVNRNLMQLLIMIDAAKRASAKRIVAVIPWYALLAPGPQDQAARAHNGQAYRQHDPGRRRRARDDDGPAHGQIEGYFTFPVDHLTAMHTFVDYFVEQGFKDAEDAVVWPPTRAR